MLETLGDDAMKMRSERVVLREGNRAFRRVLTGLALGPCCLALAALSGCGGAMAASSSSSGMPSASEVAARLAKETAGLKPITGPIDFNQQIRPILSSGCFACHGPDADMRKAGLRLDYAAPAEAKLQNEPGHRAIVPGHPEESELIRRITSTDPSVRMPHNAAALKPAQIQLIATWIKQGATYEPMWSLIPPKRMALPSAGKFQARVVNPIDDFVFSRLAQKGMAPSPEADRATLINRVSLTLTGLPPTLAQVDAFVHDKSPNAYEKVVDRLLASPAYGEHMAGMWMDLSRWADTAGYLDDAADPNLWPWRDWVIQAFNQNMPFRKFVTMQVAGDLLPHRTRDDLLATEFLRLGLRASEAGSLNEQFRIESVVDDTDTVGQALLGYTVGCARCHDHKFDPISQKDFYSFSGFFNSLDGPGVGSTQGGPTLPWPTATQQLQLMQAQRKVDDTTDAYQRVLTADANRAASEVAAWLRNPGKSRVARASTSPGPARLVPTSLVEPRAAAAQGPANEAAATRLIQSSLKQAQVAYYPFDSLQPIPKSAWPTLRLKPSHRGFFFALPYPKKAGAQAPKAGPHASKVAALSKGKAGASKSKTKKKGFSFTSDGSGAPIGGIGLDGKENPLVPVAYRLSEMKFSPSGMPNGAPAVVSEPKLGPGIKGKALYLTASQDGRTYLAHVGYYDRYQPYSVDLWFYPAKRYATYTDIFTQTNFPDSDTVDNGGRGYELVMLKDGRLEFFISHARPFNMLAVSTRTPLSVKQWAHIDVTYDGSSKAAGVHLYVDGKSLPLDVVQDNLTMDALPFISHGFFDEYTGFSFGTRFQEAGPVGSAIDEFRMFDRALTPIEVAYLHEGGQAVKTALKLDRSDLSGQLSHLLAIRQPAVMQAHEALTMARKQENDVATAIPQVLVFENLKKRRPTYLLYRGQWDSRREQVPIQAPTQLFPWSDKYPRNRLGLMQWMFDPKNPLTARVFVNRLWQMNFGTGLVTTEDDFGSQGVMPKYLHLLDYLALQFQDSGWNVKQMQKMIVMSATYRQSSVATPAQRKADPQDAWLARGPRFRMSYREIRDSALFDAGILDRKMGGPSTYPYQPTGVVRFYPQPGIMPNWEQHRRTVYSFIKRNGMNPQFELLDAADPTVSIGKLGVSNTPMQALLLLNGPQYVEAYRMMATEALHFSSDPAKQVTHVFRLARRVYPDAAQMTVLTSFYNRQLQKYQSDPQAAEQLVHVGVEPVDTSVNVARLAALTRVATLIMNAPDSYFIQ
jgi:mono/diheme cytochrome c family protein